MPGARFPPFPSCQKKRKRAGERHGGEDIHLVKKDTVTCASVREHPTLRPLHLLLLVGIVALLFYDGSPGPASGGGGSGAKTGNPEHPAARRGALGGVVSDKKDASRKVRPGGVVIGFWDRAIRNRGGASAAASSSSTSAGGGAARGTIGSGTGAVTTTISSDVRVEEAEEDFTARGGAEGSRGRHHGGGGKRQKATGGGGVGGGVGAGVGGGVSGGGGGATEKAFPGGVNTRSAAADLEKNNLKLHRKMNLKPPSSAASVCEPDDCQGRWGNWSECDSPCSRGTERRRWIATRRGSLLSNELLVLKKCPDGAPCARGDGDVEERPCEGENVDCCPGWWGSWTACTEACGGSGVRGRRFEVEIDVAPAGCRVPKVQEERCNLHACAVNCVVGSQNWVTKSDIRVRT